MGKRLSRRKDQGHRLHQGQKGRGGHHRAIEPTGPATTVEVSSERIGRLQVYTLTAKDAKGRTVPDGNVPVQVSLEGPGRIIGYGNGDPAGSEKEQSPDGKTCVLTTFSGKAQVLVLGDGTLQIKEKTI